LCPIAAFAKRAGKHDSGESWGLAAVGLCSSYELMARAIIECGGSPPLLQSQLAGVNCDAL